MGQNHCKADAPSIPEFIKIHHKLWENKFSEVGQFNFTAIKKAFVYLFVTQNRFFAMKMINYHDKQLTPSESWDQDNVLSLGLGYHNIDNKSGNKPHITYWGTRGVKVCLLKCYSVITEVLQRCTRGGTGVLQDSYKAILKYFPN